MMRRIFFFLTFLLVTASLQAQVYKKRLALVIGNSEYKFGGKLPNPINDAKAMAKSLQSLGFEVMEFENISQTQMKQAINAFGVKLKGYEVGLFYYAGHGVQSKGRNYMIPIEADLQAEEQVEFDCVAADRVLAYMEAASSKVNMIIMDACRNNPFERSWHRSTSGSGLAMMDAPTGTIIAYSTSPGRVASDGSDQNGLYTSALLKYMNYPGLNIEQVFKKVRTEVTEKSGGAQVPWETTSLTGDDFSLKPRENSVASNTSTTPTKGEVNGNTGGVGRSIESIEDPKKAEEYYASATKKYGDYAYAESIEDYTQAIKYDPYSRKAYLWRAHAKYATQQFDAAITDYSIVIQLSPGDDEAYYFRANSKYSLGKYDDAIVDFSFTLRYNVKHAKAYHYRGLCYYNLEKTEAALIDFDQAIALDVSKPDPFTYFWRANCHLLLEDYSKALTDFDKAIELKPDYADSYFWRAHGLNKQGKTAEAKKDVQKAISLDPENASYKTYLEGIGKK